MSILEINLNTKYFWIRVFKKGFSVDWDRKRKKYFSERNGLRSIFYIGFIKLEWL